jgi:fermentation-respiration switch protein FrsA (DUF1100 family)
MGAVTALRAASNRSDLAAVVADSPFLSLVDQGRHRIGSLVPGVLADYVFFFALGGGTLVMGHSPGEWEVRTWLPRIAPRPIFFIHGEVDGNILCTSSQSLAAAFAGPKEVWIVPGSGHIQARDLVRSDYERRVSAFFARELSLVQP